MCGISGIINFDVAKPVLKESLRNMTDPIIRRGPDGEGYYIDGNIGLGFRRLSIIDLSTGNQPISNEDSSIWIVFNGEIYNYTELRKELIQKGHHFKTKTDTEVIVHLYEEYGTSCLEFLRGMFAFSIWNRRKRKLFCARDRFGIKPFFYHLSDQRFVFGSEIKAVLGAGNMPESMDYQALDGYLTYNYITDNRTIYAAVKELKPAHYLEISFDKQTPEVNLSRYWTIRYNPDETLSEDDWCEALDRELSESVRMRMISDVPLGAFLSGGIDSSSVVALMSQHSDKPIKTFSIGFKRSWL